MISEMVFDWLGFLFLTLLLGMMCIFLILLIVGTAKTLCEIIIDWFNS